MEKCISWLGHKFVARYDLGARDLSRFIKFNTYDMNGFIEAMKPKTYVHDVCVRCGQIVERKK